MLLPRDYVRSCALGFGEKTAFVDGSIRRSFVELDQRSDRLAAALQELGVKKGDVVAILAHDLVEVIEHFYACMKIGAVRVGINWRYAPREMVHLVNDCQPKVIVIQDNCIPLLGDQFDAFAGDRTLIGLRGEHGMELDFETLASAEGSVPILPELSEDDRIAISYTSGTTGLPKGAIWTQKGVRECQVQTTLQMGLSPEDVFVSPGSTAGVGIVLNSFNLINGMTVVLPGGDFSAEGWLELVEREQATFSLLMPTLMRRLLDLYKAGSYNLSSLRMIAYGSEPTRPAVIREWHEVIGKELMQIYGLTEATGGWLSFLRHDEHLRGFTDKPELLTSCGRPGLHVELSIRDEQGNPLPPGEVGELWARGDVILQGYLNLPEETANTITEDGWLRCNDLGKTDEEGYYYLTDRKKFMIISGAFNVFPVVVENVLAEHPAIHECAVVGAPHPEWGEAVVAIVSLKPGSTASSEELIDHCRDKVAKWEVPKYVKIIDELPKGGTHKIAKHALREQLRKDPSELPWADQL